MKDFLRAIGVGGIFIGVIIIMSLCGVVGYVVDSLYYQHVQAPFQRQNLNNDPNYQRTIAQDFTTTYTDFQNAQQSIPSDDAALKAFSSTYGDPKTWTFQEQQQYNSLLLNWTGDYQAEDRLAAHYQELMSNPDKARWKPADLPDQLVPDKQPAQP